MLALCFTRMLMYPSLYESDFLSDVTLQLTNGDIRVHRAALAPASIWFKDYFEKDPHVRRRLYDVARSY